MWLPPPCQHRRQPRTKLPSFQGPAGVKPLPLLKSYYKEGIGKAKEKLQAQWQGGLPVGFARPWAFQSLEISRSCTSRPARCRMPSKCCRSGSGNCNTAESRSSKFTGQESKASL
mgnify:CR=1 FL=1